MENKEKTQTKQEFENRPILETHITKSKDGKYVIHKIVITDIKPVGYLVKVLGSG